MVKLSTGRHCAPATQPQLLSAPLTATAPSALCGWKGKAGLAQVSAGFVGEAPTHSAVPKSSALDSVTSVRWWIRPTPSEKRLVTAHAPDTVKSTVLTSDL